jgi:hypothetical protein
MYYRWGLPKKPRQKIPVVKSPAKKSPSKKSPPKKIPVKKIPVKKIPVKKIPVHKNIFFNNILIIFWKKYILNFFYISNFSTFFYLDHQRKSPNKRNFFIKITKYGYRVIPPPQNFFLKSLNIDLKC